MVLDGHARGTSVHWSVCDDRHGDLQRIEAAQGGRVVAQASRSSFREVVSLNQVPGYLGIAAASSPALRFVAGIAREGQT